MLEKKKIVIVGAGPGGLTSAMILAHRGFAVEVYEKAQVIGGRSAPLNLGPYKFDTGPTFLMMKFILEELFAETNRRLEDYLDLVYLDPMYRLQFDEQAIYCHSDTAKMKSEIARVFPGDEKGLDKMKKREQQRFEALMPALQRDYTKLSSLLSKEVIKVLPHMGFGRSLYDILGNYFNEEKLKLTFTFQAKYLGMSPWDCPGGFTIIPFMEHTFGLFHVQGGLSKINDAMAKVIEEEGGSIHLNSTVKKLVLASKTVKGVELENGKIIEADQVIMNADFAYAMNNLVPKGVLKKYSPENIAKKKFSCSTYMIYLGLDKLYDFPHHNIIFAQNYRANVDDIFKNQRVSDDMSIYVHNPSKIDPSLAPAGHSALYVLVPTTNNESDFDWEKNKYHYRDQVLDTIIARTEELKDIKEHIKEELIISPQDWEQKYNVFRGATFNLGHNLSQMLYFRPHNQFSELNNLYLAGGGTNPGSGLPTIYESARISANLISQNYNVAFNPVDSLQAGSFARKALAEKS